eukprot:TRINITY_DN22622_c0_g2_i1.p1 TRINITY_DN22622_c0_g2~~TRINITY_DN22622_c0_g2_i1.p1  ORF type:complete len:501 (-),score=63.32 TRINITY_DN22622_c0_g2_i1:74-1576(-)
MSSCNAGASLPSLAHNNLVLPFEFHAPLQAACHSFFSLPHVCDGSFLAANAEERAKLLADFLCGLPSGTSEVASSTVQDAPAGLSRSEDSVALNNDGRAKKPRRVLFTGCFDLMHAGHYNALRQAKAVFPGEEVTLVAGVHADDAIEAAKGAPAVLNHAERVELLQACRWVDEIAGDLPYEVPVSLLDRLNCDVAVHGDDLPRGVHGGGLFDEVMKAGRLRIVKRTEGVSSTSVIGRLMWMSKEHLLSRPLEEPEFRTARLVSEEIPEMGKQATSPVARVAVGTSEGASTGKTSPSMDPSWMLLPTMSRMAHFYAGRARSIGEATRVVYAPGEWDLFHVGHVRFLEAARKLGDFLLVGCYRDDVIHTKKGKNYPLQTLHERSLNILACKHVDDVLLGAPWTISKDLLTTFHVSIVVTGATHAYACDRLKPGTPDPYGLGDPFQCPREDGILRVVVSECDLTMDVIAERIEHLASRYKARQETKQAAERRYNEEKTFVKET